MKNNFRSFKTWIVDDDEVYKFILKRMILGDFPMCSILDFANGEESIQFLKNNTDNTNLPDIIFLDLNMPILDGWGFLDEFSELKIPESIKIFIVTSSTDQSDIDRARVYSIVDSFLVKPITNDTIKQIFFDPDKTPKI